LDKFAKALKKYRNKNEANELVELLKDRENEIQKPEKITHSEELRESAPQRATPEKKERPFDVSPELYDHKAIDTNLVSLLDPQSYEAEQFKLLRTYLLYSSLGKTPRSVVITSPSPGDGKSFVAANLAVSVALNIDRHVLLMDCDLRQPNIHKKFGFGSVPGLTDYLTKGTSLSDLILKTKVARLTILPGGTPPPNPSELLSSERMSSLIEEVINRYDDRLIIIDSPPPTLTAETGVLARRVDGILLVVKYRKTRREDIRKLIEKMGKENMLGCVVNNFDMISRDYYNYREYGGYGSYYSNKS
jgi:exopolysaccharide/PEP-CTERM locus tyrosine autokinase